MVYLKSNLNDENNLSLFDALESLNHISRAINNIGSNTVSKNVDPLDLIVRNTTKVFSGSSAEIFILDDTKDVFSIQSHITSESVNGEIISSTPDNIVYPRSNGFGILTFLKRKSVLSYQEPGLDIQPDHLAQGVKVVGCFPLIVSDQMMGLFYIYLYEERVFSRLELMLIDNFSNLAAMAIYHSRRLDSLSKGLERKQEDLERLHRASMLISSRLRLEETLESILQLALEMTNAPYGIFRLLDRNGENLITRAFAGKNMTRPKIEALPVDQNSVMGRVAITRQPILIPDLLSEPWSKIYYPLDADLKMRSEIAIPLINTSGRLEGVLNLESPELKAFDENQSFFLQSLASYAVIAIQDVRLLDVLQDISQKIFSQSINKVLNYLTKIASDLLNASDASIWLIHGSDLILEASNGGHEHGERIPIENSLMGQAVLTRLPITTNNVLDDPRFFRKDIAKSQNYQRALIIPLISHESERPIGTFGVYSSGEDPGRFAESEWDKKVLTLLAHNAVLALENDAHQRALRLAQEKQSIAETFAVIGDIASNLMHHLNNKVGTIPIRVQNIQEKCAPSLQADPYLNNNLIEIERYALEAMQSVRENLSQLGPIRIEQVKIDKLIKDAIISQKLPPGIDIQTRDLENLPFVNASGKSLTLVFSNLIENAIDAMQGIGTIQIIGKSNNKLVEVLVTDSGPGISPELHEKIFELNYSGRSGNGNGKLGFGLWWVKTLMTRLGGFVEVESDGKHGSSFRLVLLLDEE